MKLSLVVHNVTINNWFSNYRMFKARNLEFSQRKLSSKCLLISILTEVFILVKRIDWFPYISVLKINRIRLGFGFGPSRAQVKFSWLFGIGFVELWVGLFLERTDCIVSAAPSNPFLDEYIPLGSRNKTIVLRLSWFIFSIWSKSQNLITFWAIIGFVLHIPDATWSFNGKHL